MLDSVITTAQQTAVLFVMMGFGVLARHLRIFDAETIRRFTEFLIKFITPCLIVSSFQRPCESERIVSLGWTFAAAAAATIAAIFLSRAFIRAQDVRHRRALEWAVVFSNCGYMGIPLEEAILGPDGVFYGISAIAVFNIFAWTYGVSMMGGAVGLKGFVKGALNPANVAVAVALPLFFAPWRLPFVMARPIESIGSLNTPIAMLVMGYYLASAKFAPAFRCAATYAMLFMRHFAVPLMLLAVLWQCPFIDRTARLAAIIPAAAPVGVLLTVFAVKYDCDAEFSTAVVAVSTVFSIITIPLVMAIAVALF
ncbi:MAG: AEC family transporter [Kiritimatiellae bacterium]|nr:AEC family transporter [Kiritimatiellia bacterium]